MTITLDHPSSEYGVPVALDDDGALLAPNEGLQKAQELLGWTNIELAERTNKKIRMIVHYRKGTHAIPADVWNVLSHHLSKKVQ